jgi:hypothetical protein
MNAEIWEPVPGFEGCYEVSSLGQVKSLSRVIRRFDGTTYVVPERLLATATKGKNYPVVNLHGVGIRRVIRVHRLVAEVFLGPQPADGLEVCHNDGDRNNNAATNLRWDTRAANINDQKLHGVHPLVKITHCSRGHEFTPENTRYYRQNSRICRQCRREDGPALRVRYAESRRATAQKYKARLKAERIALQERLTHE